MYYRGAAAAIVVYDITQPDSFKDVASWVDELNRNAEPGLVLAVVANKADVQTSGTIPHSVRHPPLDARRVMQRQAAGGAVSRCGREGAALFLSRERFAVCCRHLFCQD